MNPVRQFLDAHPTVWFFARLTAVALLVWWIHHSGYSSGAHDKGLEWSEKWNKQAAELATARADAVTAAREVEQRRQADIEKVRQDAEQEIARAESDAAAASAVAAGLHEQARRLAARANQCASHTGDAQPGETARQPAVVLADLLSRADARAGELARAYDRARASGLACERAYHSLISQQ